MDDMTPLGKALADVWLDLDDGGYSEQRLSVLLKEAGCDDDAMDKLAARLSKALADAGYKINNKETRTIDTVRDDMTAAQIIGKFCKRIARYETVPTQTYSDDLIQALTAAGKVIVDREPTREQLQAIYDGPLGPDDDVMDEKTEAWLREMWRAVTTDTGS